FVKATTDGVTRRPSEFSSTTGSPPSMTAMQEFVVPKSIPITFAIKCSWIYESWNSQAAGVPSRSPICNWLHTRHLGHKSLLDFRENIAPTAPSWHIGSRAWHTSDGTTTLPLIHDSAPAQGGRTCRTPMP